MKLPPGDLTEQQLITLIQENSEPKRPIEQRFLDELNKYGRIVSTEEFLEQAKQKLNQ